ncbi:MAG: hypothetical protein ACE37N_13320 [Pseudohongiellaceae bacterium]
MIPVQNKSCWLLLLVVLPWCAAIAAPLDKDVAADPLLGPLAALLDRHGIDVIANLNDRTQARRRPQQPRLGRFPDLPFRQFPSSLELAQFERGFAAGELTGLALLGNDTVASESSNSPDDFVSAWLRAPAEDRVFVSLVVADLEVAENLAVSAGDRAWQPLLLINGMPVETAGTLFATAAQRLAIDSLAARDYRGELPDLAWLGERLRRNSESIFSDPGNRDDRRLARQEPAVFVKETLGDEFSESTIREIIVPGGVALGETARLSQAIAAARFADEALTLVGADGTVWPLPDIEPATLKSLFDFVARSQAIGSDAIVDIDAQRRVSLNAALEDTDPGYAIMHADTLPFEFVSNLRVTKSVIVDTEVEWFAAGGDDEQLVFESRFEVRFLSADNMRIAQTRVALQYEYDSRTPQPEYYDAWGRDVPRLRENLDYAGLGKGVEPVARYAGWIALWRKLHEDEIQFTEGRYQFMKLNKNGRATPARY